MQMFPLPDAARAEPVAAASADPMGPLRRPASLLRAGRAGAALYRREKHLRVVAPEHASPRRKARDVVRRLAALEAECDARRRRGAPAYAPARHVLLLSALLAERAAAACGG